MEQLKLNFEGGLLDKFETLEEVVDAVIVDDSRLRKTIAGELDIRPSDLSRMSSGGDLNFPVSKLPKLMELTGDYRPIYWQVEKFLKEKTAFNKQEALAEVKVGIGQLLRTLERIEAAE